MFFAENGVIMMYIKAAKKAGMKCVGYRNTNPEDQDLSEANIIIDSFYDSICLYIDKLNFI